MKKIKQKNVEMKKKKNPSLSLMMGVYNEEQNIESVYREAKKVLLKAKIPFEIIFIEGGSTDNSYKILQNLSKKNKDCFVVKSNKSPGKKAEAGLRIARGKYASFMCSDGQDDPSMIPKAIKLLESNKADFVKGKRIKRTFIERKIISMVFNNLVRILHPIGINDINGHPKVFRKEFLKGVYFISEYESIDLEIMLRAHHRGYRVVEIPLVERTRKEGKSSTNFSVAFRIFTDIFSYKWGRKHVLLLESLRQQASA